MTSGFMIPKPIRLKTLPTIRTRISFPCGPAGNILPIRQDRTMNLFVYNLDTKQTTKVTNFTDYDIKFPSLGGDYIVFEKEVICSRLTSKPGIQKKYRSLLPMMTCLPGMS
jgi:hypothetical protein